MDPRQHPVDALHEEHRVIRSTLDALAAEANHLLGTKHLRQDYWLPLLQFLEHFADRSHDEKEERFLFPALVAAGMGDRHGPLPVLRKHHEQARSLRARMLDAFASRDLDALAHAASAYAEHVRTHIEHEERMLFPLALESLDDEAIESIRQQFVAHDESLGIRHREKWLLAADSLASGASPRD